MRDISLDRVSKVYPSGVRALDDVSLSVGAGDWLVLVGPSGCGKTTLLRLIAGLERPTAGSVRLAGQVVNDVPAHRRGVALVFQRPALVANQTVRDNLAWPWTLGRADPWRLLKRLCGGKRLRPDEEAAVRQTAQLLGLEGLLDRRAAELSGGQQQRVVLGRTLLRRAGVCLLDEPLAHLEAPLRAQLRRELRLLYRQYPATMVYVTHDPAEALALNERVAVLLAGRVCQVGDPDAIGRRPASRFVAEFFQPTPWNFFDGRLTDDGGKTFFVGPWGRWEVPDEVRHRLTTADVTAGVRADDVKVRFTDSFGGASPIIIESSVVLTERTAQGNWVLCQTRGGRITGVSETNRDVALGQQTMLTFSLERASWFERTTGVTLLAPAG